MDPPSWTIKSSNRTQSYGEAAFAEDWVPKRQLGLVYRLDSNSASKNLTPKAWLNLEARLLELSSNIFRIGREPTDRHCLLAAVII